MAGLLTPYNFMHLSQYRCVYFVPMPTTTATPITTATPVTAAPTPTPATPITTAMPEQPTTPPCSPTPMTPPPSPHVVRTVLKRRRRHDWTGAWEHLVWWDGHTQDEASWEPREHLDHHTDADLAAVPMDYSGADTGTDSDDSEGEPERKRQRVGATRHARPAPRESECTTTTIISVANRRQRFFSLPNTAAVFAKYVRAQVPGLGGMHLVDLCAGTGKLSSALRGHAAGVTMVEVDTELEPELRVAAPEARRIMTDAAAVENSDLPGDTSTRVVVANPPFNKREANEIMTAAFTLADTVIALLPDRTSMKTQHYWCLAHQTPVQELGFTGCSKQSAPVRFRCYRRLYHVLRPADLESRPRPLIDAVITKWRGGGVHSDEQTINKYVDLARSKTNGSKARGDTCQRGKKDTGARTIPRHSTQLNYFFIRACSRADAADIKLSTDLLTKARAAVCADRPADGARHNGACTLGLLALADKFASFKYPGHPINR